MTSSTLTRLAPTQVEIEIPISQAELDAAGERAFRKMAKNVRLPGFRQGKVPRKVFEQTYGAESIANQAMDDVVPEAYAKAVREHDLEPIDQPHMELLPEEEGKPTRLRAVVDVRPEIDLGVYKGVEVAVAATPVTDEDLERSLISLAKDRATLVPVDRAARLGDMITMDYEGKIDGVAFEGGTATGQTTELDDERFIPGFATGIAGMKAGETKDVDATFPEQYGQPDLAGKKAVFTIVLHDVKELELPALDDAFAASISENATMEALRADVRTRLEAIAASRTRRAVGNALMEQLLAKQEFDLPPVLVEREIDQMLNDAAGSAARSGVNFEEYLTQIGKTEDELRAEFRTDAMTRVKGTLFLEAIAKAEHLAATPADVSAELQSLAQQYGQPVEAITKALGSNVRSLMDGILRNKTLEFLIDNATVVEPT